MNILALMGVDQLKSGVRQLYEQAKASCQVAISLLVVMWVLSVLDFLTSSELSSQGIHPREFPMGYFSILWAFFLHKSVGALLTNTLPFLALASLLLVRSTAEFVFLTTVHIAIAGTLIWAMGPEHSNFVGSSSLIFAYFAYLVAIGTIEQDMVSVLVSLATLFLYGSLAVGLILPSSSSESPWIINVLGFCIGVTFAVAHNKYLKDLSACRGQLGLGEDDLDEENAGLLNKKPSPFEDDDTTAAAWAQ